MFLYAIYLMLRASLLAQMVKNLPAVQEIYVQSLGQEDPLEKEIATHSVFLPGKSHGAWQTTPWGNKDSHKTAAKSQ